MMTQKERKVIKERRRSASRFAAASLFGSFSFGGSVLLLFGGNTPIPIWRAPSTANQHRSQNQKTIQEQKEKAGYQNITSSKQHNLLDCVHFVKANVRQQQHQEINFLNCQ
jgi:hypothetical protein